MADDFKIKIVTEGDSRGAEKVADTLGKVTRAANDNAKAAAQTSRGMNELGEASEKGAAVGRVFGQVMSGNVGALAQLGAALKATGAALKTNIAGIALIGATALVSFLQQVRGGTKEMGDAAGEAAPKIDAFADALKKAGDAKNEALSKALATIKDEAKGAAEELEHVLRLQERIAKANGTDTPEEQRRREDLRLGNQFQSAQERRDRTAEVAGAASGEVAAIEGTLSGYQSQRDQRRALELEFKNLQRQTGGTSPEAMARGDRMQEIKKALDASQGIDSPEQRAAEAAQAKRLGPARSAAESAAKEAAAAEEEFRRIGRTVVGVRPDGRAIPSPGEAAARAAEDRAARRAAGLPEPEQREYSSKSEIVDGRPMEISIKGSDGVEIGQRIAAAVEARIKAGEENTARIVENQMKRFEQQLKSQRTK